MGLDDIINGHYVSSVLKDRDSVEETVMYDDYILLHCTHTVCGRSGEEVVVRSYYIKKTRINGFMVVFSPEKNQDVVYVNYGFDREFSIDETKEELLALLEG